MTDKYEGLEDVLPNGYPSNTFMADRSDIRARNPLPTTAEDAEYTSMVVPEEGVWPKRDTFSAGNPGRWA